MVVGSRAQVFHGTADKTSGGLTKSDLMMKDGRIKSRRASRSAKKNKNLVKAGWTVNKGEFGAVRVEDVKKKKGTPKKKKSPKRSSKR
mgnify:CR=1 FL=1|tara:strand:+ start:533 stop:796 length:264 start_codon:yes stop_codon:yes gene_type:complete